jgi:hypothetical protein
MWPVSGTGPSDSVNVWNCPGAIPPASAVNVTSVVASLMVLPSTLTGLGSVVLAAAPVHPAVGW